MCCNSQPPPSLLLPLPLQWLQQKLNQLIRRHRKSIMIIVSLFWGRWEVSKSSYSYCTSLTYCYIYVIYILFRIHLDVQIGFWSTEGKRGREEALLRNEALVPKLRQGVEQSDDDGRVNLASGDHRNPSYSCSSWASGNLLASLLKCVWVFAEAHTTVELLLESLCLSTLLCSLLHLLFRSDHSREAMSCFIHQDASPSVLNPSVFF